MDRFSEYTQISNFIKIRQVGAEFFHAYRRTNMSNLLVALRNFAKAPKTGNVSSVGQLFFAYFHTNSPVFQVFQLSAIYTLLFFCILFLMFLCVCCSVIFAHPWRSAWYKVSYTARLHPAITWVHLSFAYPFRFHNHSTICVGMVLQENCTLRVVWLQSYAFQCCKTWFIITPLIQRNEF
jgi:hypothetical protein